MGDQKGYLTQAEFDRIRDVVLRFEGASARGYARPGKGQAFIPRDVHVRLDGPISGAGGMYVGTIVRGKATVTVDQANLTLPLGMVADGLECVVVVADEDGLPTHWAADGSFADGLLIGYSDEAGESEEDDRIARPVVRVTRARYRMADPETLGSGSERLEPDGANWTRGAAASGTAYGDGPVALWVGRGAFWDHTTTPPTFKQHMRQITIAADGRIAAISAEADYVIDDPGACS